jgi:hypothetical protein
MDGQHSEPHNQQQQNQAQQPHQHQHQHQQPNLVTLFDLLVAPTYPYISPTMDTSTSMSASSPSSLSNLQQQQLDFTLPTPTTTTTTMDVLGIQSLAPELMVAIFRHLDAKGLVAACSVCRDWNSVIKEHDSILWRRLAEEEYWVADKNCRTCSWKESYRIALQWEKGRPSSFKVLVPHEQSFSYNGVHKVMFNCTSIALYEQSGILVYGSDIGSAEEEEMALDTPIRATINEPPLWIWDLNEIDAGPKAAINEHTFSGGVVHDGHLFSVTEDLRVQVTNLSTHERKFIDYTLDNEDDYQPLQSMCFKPYYRKINGEPEKLWILTATLDYSIRYFDPVEHKWDRQHFIKTGIPALAMDILDNTLAVAGENTVEIWDLIHCQKINTIRIRKKMMGSCEIRLTKKMIVVDYGETAEFPHVFNLEDGELLYEMRDICEREKEIIEDFSNFGSCYFAVIHTQFCFLLLNSARQGDHIVMFDLRTGRLVSKLKDAHKQEEEEEAEEAEGEAGNKDAMKLGTSEIASSLLVEDPFKNAVTDIKVTSDGKNVFASCFHGGFFNWTFG